MSFTNMLHIICKKIVCNNNLFLILQNELNELKNQKTVKNRMRDEFCHNNSTTYLSTSGKFNKLSPIYCSGSLEYLAFFSSNSCIFYHQTEKSRFNCPTGGFQCDGNGTRLFYETNDLTYSEAISYCRQRNASLCKYAGINRPWRHQIDIIWSIWWTISYCT